MEIYKYILLILGLYMAICSIFSKTLKKTPICFENIAGKTPNFIAKCAIIIGFVYWFFEELRKRFFVNQEGWMSISEIKRAAGTDEKLDVSLIPSDVQDIPDVPCPENNASLLPDEEDTMVRLINLQKQQELSESNKIALAELKTKKQRANLSKTTGEIDINRETGMCRGQFSDIPNNYYGFTITTREPSDKSTNNNVRAGGKIVNEKKMRPIASVGNDCKLKTDSSGKPTVEKAIQPKNASSNSTACVNKINILKSEKNKRQYDPNDFSKIRNKELTPNEKEEKQKNFEVDINLVNPKPVYYEPGSYTFGASTYVPNYEQSVYLSKTTGLSQTAPLSLTPNNTGGFCKSMKNDKIGLDKKCQSLSQDVCPSTSCCVLLGGEKCFGGDETGPANKAAFSDTKITNRDYYYYKSKCYGNCP